MDEMADTIMDGLLEYAELATDVMKDCVKKAGNTVKKETQANAPVCAAWDFHGGYGAFVYRLDQ